MIFRTILRCIVVDYMKASRVTLLRTSSVVLVLNRKHFLHVVAFQSAYFPGAIILGFPSVSCDFSLVIRFPYFRDFSSFSRFPWFFFRFYELLSHQILTCASPFVYIWLGNIGNLAPGSLVICDFLFCFKTCPWQNKAIAKIYAAGSFSCWYFLLIFVAVKV